MPESAPAEQQIVPLDRAARITCAVVLGASLLGAIWVQATKKPKAPTTSATAQWDVRYPSDNAVDGDDSTDWILPDKTLGELEVKLEKPRKIARVKITNARNPPYFDRGTRELRVEAYKGDAMVKSEVIRFNTPTRAPESRTMELGAEIDRVKLVVLSYYLLGAGVSEVALESR